MTDVRVIDTTLRDGNQSLWGALGMDTATVLEGARAIDRAGYRVVELINSTIMAMAVRRLHEDPWERIRRAAEAMPNTPLGFITTGRRFITWHATPDAQIELAYSLLARNGIRRLWAIDPMNDVAAARRTATIAKRAGIEEVAVGLVYSISPVHDDAYYEQRARELRAAPDVDLAYLKDPGGLLTPERVRTLVPTIAGALGGEPALEEIHSHCNTGLAPLCYLEAVDQGIGTVHCAVSPLGNGTSQPATETLVANLRARGHDVALDDEAVEQSAAYFRHVARRDGFPTGAPAEYDADYYRHQVPGGMMSTLRRQLAELGLQDRLEGVLEEAVRVREELGFPIMVTPFSQFVGTQALLNVAGGERWVTVADEVIRYAQGEFGTPPLPIDEGVRERVASLPRAREIERERAEQDDGSATLADLRGRLGRRVSDEELLLRAVMPSDQVDGIRRRPVTVARSALGRELRDMLRVAARRSDMTLMELRRPGCRVVVRREGP
jgi:oxaloacetate decarboxylase (Na+ extruding) subunit alpha